MKKIMIKEILFWVILAACCVIVFICNQYSGYRMAEKDILRSCMSNSEFTIEGIRLVCISCGTDKNEGEKDEEDND